jgi:hypothetical protein
VFNALENLGTGMSFDGFDEGVPRKVSQGVYNRVEALGPTIVIS